MKKIYPSTQFKKDLKKHRNDKEKMAALAQVVDMLAREEDLPARFRPHRLLGDYKNCMECHIKGDFLLVWFNGDVIELVRLGSHSELFK